MTETNKKTPISEGETEKNQSLYSLSEKVPCQKTAKHLAKQRHSTWLAFGYAFAYAFALEYLLSKI